MRPGRGRPAGGRAERGVARTTLLALLLALLSAAFALRAVLDSAPTAVPNGVFGAPQGPRARALVAQLTRGLLSLQRTDGGFDLGTDGEYSYLIERVASSALATATLASLQAGPPDPQEGLRQAALRQVALARGLDYLNCAPPRSRSSASPGPACATAGRAPWV